MADLFGTEPQLAPDEPVGLGKMMAGGGAKAKRRANDFYPTPPDVTRALLRQEHHCIWAKARELPVWEPCGRGGAILRELQAHGFDTIGTDIVADPENHVAPLDLLQAKRRKGAAVVTNPPFALAEPMIIHLWDRLKVDYMALLLKATYWNAGERAELFRRFKPARIYAVAWRPDFTGGGNPTMDVCWYVWQRQWPLGTQFSVLERHERAPELGGI